MRDWSVSASAPHTTSAASKVQPPTKRERSGEGPVRPATGGRRTIRSWREVSAAADRPPGRPERSSRCERRSSSSSVLKSPVRPAASSIASGRSSSRVQSSAVAAVVENDGSTASARAVKSSTASGSASEGTGQTCSPLTRSRSLLVTSTFGPSRSRRVATSRRAREEMLDVVEHSSAACRREPRPASR